MSHEVNFAPFRLVLRRARLGLTVSLGDRLPGRSSSKASGVFCAAFVVVMVLLLGPLTRYIPKAALAGLLIVAAARLIDVERLR